MALYFGRNQTSLQKERKPDITSVGRLEPIAFVVVVVVIFFCIVVIFAIEIEEEKAKETVLDAVRLFTSTIGKNKTAVQQTKRVGHVVVLFLPRPRQTQETTD